MNALPDPIDFLLGVILDEECEHALVVKEPKVDKKIVDLNVNMTNNPLVRHCMDKNRRDYRSALCNAAEQQVGLNVSIFDWKTFYTHRLNTTPSSLVHVMVCSKNILELMRCTHHGGKLVTVKELSDSDNEMGWLFKRIAFDSKHGNLFPLRTSSE